MADLSAVHMCQYKSKLNRYFLAALHKLAPIPGIPAKAQTAMRQKVKGHVNGTRMSREREYSFVGELACRLIIIIIVWPLPV